MKKKPKTLAIREIIVVEDRFYLKLSSVLNSKQKTQRVDSKEKC
jgi:hypothetical protein